MVKVVIRDETQIEVEIYSKKQMAYAISCLTSVIDSLNDFYKCVDKNDHDNCSVKNLADTSVFLKTWATKYLKDALKILNNK